MTLQLKTDPATTSNENVRHATHRAGVPLGLFVSAVFLAMAAYALWIAAWRAMFIALGCAVAMPIAIPIAWAIGNFLRKVAAPDAIVTTGMKDTLKQRAFWLFGPQLIACGLFTLPAMLIVTDALKAGQKVAAQRARDEARAKEAEETRAIIEKNRQERDERLAQLPSATPEAEAAFRAQVETVASAMGLPLGACLSQELLGMTCESAGMTIDPSIAQIGLVPMKVGLASRQPTEQEVQGMILKHFAVTASRAASGDTTLIDPSMPCTGSVSPPELKRQISVAMRDLFFAAQKMQTSPIEEKIWDWIVEANGLTPVIMSVGPYPFETPSEALVKAWNGSISALKARDQESVNRVEALKSQWQWERQVLAQFSADQQRLLTADGPGGMPQPVRTPSREEANALQLSGGGSKVGEMQVPRSTKTIVYAVVKPGGALPSRRLEQNANDTASLSLRVLGAEQPNSRREVTFPLPVGSDGAMLVQRLASEVPWGGIVRFLVPSDILPALGLSGPAKSDRAVIECEWVAYWITLRDPNRSMPPFQDSPMVLAEQLKRCLGDRFMAGSNDLGRLNATVTDPVACLLTADAFEQILKQGAAGMLDSPVPEAKFAAGVPASVPVKW